MKSLPVWLVSVATMAQSHATGQKGPLGLATPKIDVHTHIYPDFYAKAVEAAGHLPGPDGNPAAPVWGFGFRRTGKIKFIESY